MFSWQQQLLTEVDLKGIGEQANAINPEQAAILDQKIKDMPDTTKSAFISLLGKNMKSLPEVLLYLNTFSKDIEVKGTSSIPTQSRPIWVKIAKQNPGNQGRGEMYIYLTTKGAQYSGGEGTKDYDLVIDGKPWEVKEISNTNSSFRLGPKKGLLSKYDNLREFYQTTNILSKIELLFQDEEIQGEIKKLSPKLFKTLQDIPKYTSDRKNATNTFKDAITQGVINDKVEKFYSDLKKNINEAFTQLNKIQKAQKFTNVTLGGQGVKSRSSKIAPLDPSEIKKGLIMIDFLEDETKNILELLSDLPTFNKDLDLSDELDKTHNDILQNLVNFYLMTKDTTQIVVAEEDEVRENFERAGVSQGNLEMRANQDFFTIKTGITKGQRGRPSGSTNKVKLNKLDSKVSRDKEDKGKIRYFIKAKEFDKYSNNFERTGAPMAYPGSIDKYVPVKLKDEKKQIERI